MSSDSWIIDPEKNQIFKRRLGEKGIRIVYDKNQHKNVEIQNPEQDRRRFAIETSRLFKLLNS